MLFFFNLKNILQWWRGFSGARWQNNLLIFVWVHFSKEQKKYSQHGKGCWETTSTHSELCCNVMPFVSLLLNLLLQELIFFSHFGVESWSSYCPFFKFKHFSLVQKRISLTPVPSMFGKHSIGKGREKFCNFLFNLLCEPELILSNSGMVQIHFRWECQKLVFA